MTLGDVFYLLIDVNGMSTNLRLFFADRLGNHVHCTFVLLLLSKIFFFKYDIKYFYHIQIICTLL